MFLCQFQRDVMIFNDVLLTITSQLKLKERKEKMKIDNLADVRRSVV